MGAIAVLAHALSIGHGVGATRACGACFYVAGLALIPRRWSESVGRGETPALMGAALPVLLCWLGITSGIPLTRVAIAFAGTVLAWGLDTNGLIYQCQERLNEPREATSGCMSDCILGANDVDRRLRGVHW